MGSSAVAAAVSSLPSKMMSHSNNNSNSSHCIPSSSQHANEEDSSAMEFSEGSFDQSLDGASTGTSSHHRISDHQRSGTGPLMHEDNSSDAQFPDGDGGVKKSK